MRYLVFVLFSTFCICSQAQEASGLSLGNNGADVTSLNPSFSLKSTYKWNFRLAGAHLFAETNYGYINNTNLFNLVSNFSELEIPDVNNDATLDGTSLNVLFNNTASSYNIDTKVEALGPAFNIEINDQVFGFSTKARGYASGFGLPSGLRADNFRDVMLDSILTIEPFDLSGAAWMEYALHYAKKTDYGSFGVNAKYLKSYASAFIDNDITFSYVNESNDLTRATSPGNVRFSFPDSMGISTNGTGLSFDLGWGTEMVNRPGERIGVSILDLGLISINQNVYEVTFDSLSNLIRTEYDNITDYASLLDQLAEDAVSVDSTSGYNMWMPTAISVQYSKAITNDIKIEAALTQRLPMPGTRIYRSNSLNVTGVYEKKNFAAYLPITLYDYQKPIIGTALRFYYLTIGSDNLFSLIGNQNQFDGTDFYVAFNIYPFWSKSTSNSKSNDQINCPSIYHEP